jgi:adenylate cyclase
MRRCTPSTDNRDMSSDAGRSREPATSEQWRTLLIEGHAALVKGRRVFRYLPAEPRCKVCGNPFGGVAGHVLAAAGFRPSRKNPNLCTRCCDAMPVGGAEVDVAVLFADVRGSTGLAERTGAEDFAALLNRFYFAATRALLRYDAVIDKLIGDEVMAFFVPGISGAEYRQRTVEAGLALLRAVGYGSPEGPWIELGAAGARGDRLRGQHRHGGGGFHRAGRHRQRGGTNAATRGRRRIAGLSRGRRQPGRGCAAAHVGTAGA